MTIFILFVLGLILGSFVNAVVWRLHGQTKGPKRSDLSILKGRSMCPSCRHSLNVKDLVPVASWISLKGRCRYCQKPVSRQYPAVELLTAVLFVVSYAWWPAPLAGAEAIRFGCWLLFLAGFVALVVYDLRWMLLPHRIVYPLIGLALLQWAAIWALYGLNAGQLAGIGLSTLVGGGLFYLLFQLSEGKWIGGGDVKLGFLLGLIVADPAQSWLLLFLAATLGSLITLPLLLTGKATGQSRVPFGPFLMAGGLVVMLFGPAIITWLERAVLL